MDTYLTRPVLSMAIDWSTNPVGRITYNLNEIPTLSGPESFWSDETYTVNGWSFIVPATTAAQIAEVDALLEELLGRLNGFWLPAPQACFEVVSAAGTDLVVEWADNATRWDANAPMHVRLVTAGVTTYAEVTNVVDNLDGTETVTLDTTVIEANSTTVVSMLNYVRLATDLLTCKTNGEQSADYSFACVELPHEYVEAITGAKPIFLYHFWIEDGSTGSDWRLGNFAENITSGGNTFTAAPITHAGLEHSMAGMSRVQITSRRDIAPFNLLLPARIDQRIKVEILQASLTSVSITRTLFFGYVNAVTTTGQLITVECAAVNDSDAVQVPGFLFQPKCNHRLFSTGCGKSSGDAGMRFTVTLSSLSADKRTVTASAGGFTASQVANYFAEGMLEVGDNEAIQRVTIGSSTDASGGSCVLTLLRPLTGSPASGYVYAGCDGSFGTCDTKFDNVANFGGHRFAARNLALKAIDIPELDAGKK